MHSAGMMPDTARNPDQSRVARRGRSWRARWRRGFRADHDAPREFLRV